MWLVLGLCSCARITPSAAPLSAWPEPQPATAVATGPLAAPREGAKPNGKPAGKPGKRALYARSCELGSAIGCNDLAILLGSADAQALPSLERACSLGLTRGCANLGAELLRNEPTNAARSRALRLLADACERNDEFGCSELGDGLYAEQARGDTSALGRAHTAYEKACKLGQLVACFSEAWMLKNGEGTPKDPRRARELFRFLCNQEGYDACAALGFDLMGDAQTREEFDEGVRWSQLACEHDAAFGCYTLGRLAAGSPDDALKLLKRSCVLGFPDACKQAAALEERLKHPAAAASDADSDED